MKAEDKYKAASQAALGFLEKAGYVIKDGKAITAPAGAKLEYECIIPADGVGDHPSFAILTAAKEAFAKIGINIIINDPADSNELWDKLDAGSQELWCAAWGATIDPDMYQVYHSSNIVGLQALQSLTTIIFRMLTSISTSWMQEQVLTSPTERLSISHALTSSLIGLLRFLYIRDRTASSTALSVLKTVQ